MGADLRILRNITMRWWRRNLKNDFCWFIERPYTAWRHVPRKNVIKTDIYWGLYGIFSFFFFNPLQIYVLSL